MKGGINYGKYSKYLSIGLYELKEDELRILMEAVFLQLLLRSRQQQFCLLHVKSRRSCWKSFILHYTLNYLKKEDWNVQRKTGLS